MTNEWRSIDTAPRDGTIVEVGCPGEVCFPMRWNPTGSNAFFQPEPTGIWEVPDRSMTWTEHDGAGPTHWRPIELAEAA